MPWLGNDRYCRNNVVVVHAQQLVPDLHRTLPVAPSVDGPLTILRTPGGVAYQGPAPNVVHPLLAYTEMVTSADARTRSAAEELRERHLVGIG